jgi:predicted enzyme related to lactoylglutathione lyase
MPNPVVHFEIMGKESAKLGSFYSGLFGWKVDADNPMHYGMVDTGGQGIPGGIGDEPDGSNRVTVYVQVDDLQKYLDDAVSRGGSVIMPPTEIPGAVTMAMFADPAGNTVGMIKG